SAAGTGPWRGRGHAGLPPGTGPAGRQLGWRPLSGPAGRASPSRRCGTDSRRVIDTASGTARSEADRATRPHNFETELSDWNRNARASADRHFPEKVRATVRLAEEGEVLDDPPAVNGNRRSVQYVADPGGRRGVWVDSDTAHEELAVESDNGNDELIALPVAPDRQRTRLEAIVDGDGDILGPERHAGNCHRNQRREKRVLRSGLSSSQGSILKYRSGQPPGKARLDRVGRHGHAP